MACNDFAWIASLQLPSTLLELLPSCAELAISTGSPRTLLPPSDLTDTMWNAPTVLHLDDRVPVSASRVPSESSASSEHIPYAAADLRHDEIFDLSLNISYTGALRAIIGFRPLDLSGSRPWLAAARDRQYTLLKQDSDLPSEAIKVSASTRPSLLPIVTRVGKRIALPAFATLGAYTLELLLSIVKPIAAFHLEIHTSVSWEVAGRDVFTALRCLPLSYLSSAALPTLEKHDANTSLLLGATYTH